jgi:hypothetical protein
MYLVSQRSAIFQERAGPNGNVSQQSDDRVLCLIMSLNG